MSPNDPSDGSGLVALPLAPATAPSPNARLCNAASASIDVGPVESLQPEKTNAANARSAGKVRAFEIVIIHQPSKSLWDDLAKSLPVPPKLRALRCPGVARLHQLEL